MFVRKGAPRPGNGDEGVRTAWVLALYVLVAAGSAAMQKLNVPLPQFLLGVRELVATGRIHSTFLPVGYPVVLSPVYAFGPKLGIHGVYAGVVLLNLLCGVATFLYLQQLLRRVVSARAAAWAALIISLCPELLRAMSSVSDTGLSNLLVVANLLLLVRMVETPTLRRALAFGIILGLSLLVRSNLVLFGLAILVPAWRVGWRRAATLVGTTGIATVAMYLLVTTAVHGRPFFPQNGAYNVFAGMNEDTMAYSTNGSGYAEMSILPALAARGYHPRLDWSVPSDQPGVDDSRDLRYVPVYREAAKQYAVSHPGQAIRLTALKLYMLFRPFRLAGISVWCDKWLLLIALWRIVAILWAAVAVWDWMRGGRGPLTIAPGMAVLYILPFLLTNSDPRFGTPVEVLLSLDLARLLLQRKKSAKSELYFTSAPRPAA